MAKTHVQEVLVQIQFTNLEILWGRVQIPADMGIISYFNQPAQFFVLGTDLGRSLLINKHQIIKIEPQEARSIDPSKKFIGANESEIRE